MSHTLFKLKLNTKTSPFYMTPETNQKRKKNQSLSEIKQWTLSEKIRSLSWEPKVNQCSIKTSTHHNAITSHQQKGRVWKNNPPVSYPDRPTHSYPERPTHARLEVGSSAGSRHKPAVSSCTASMSRYMDGGRAHEARPRGLVSG